MLPWTPQQQQQPQPQAPGSDAGSSDGSGAGNGGPNGGGAGAMSLASCLFFLQSEFRRHERDRNEWSVAHALEPI